MKQLIIIFASLLVSACTIAQANGPAPTELAPPPPLKQRTPSSEKNYAGLPDLGAAPELENQVWLNTDRVLRLGDLRGKVVLLDMWTFG